MSDAPDTATVEDGAAEADSLDAYASALAERLGANAYTVEFGTVRILVDSDRWVETVVAANEELPFFSWLSAIDWSKEIQVGDPVADVENLEERFEILCRLSSVENADGAILVTSIGKDDPSIDSLTPHLPGAAWHEREAHEMFGIDFPGNTNLMPLYLPDDFIGHPLLKSYPLLAREVKPWPGDVDVEGMPGSDDDEEGTSEDADGDT
ncbi:MAG TPA: NADH-quinone oxidoreductase subunit C [Acidimicrobiia bacterium]|nr:NADH-quinone oxidoreductase subunit C [Acidimicrobiia bacterium]